MIAEEYIEEQIYRLMNDLNIERMPTVSEVRSSKIVGLENRITRSGGFNSWAEKLNLSKKRETQSRQFDTIEDEINNGIKEVCEILNIDRMPTFQEIKATINRGKIITRLIKENGGYRYWADINNLSLKDCETNLGIDYEYYVIEKLNNLGYKTEKMSTLHPFDILANDSIRIDVKVSNLYTPPNKSSFYKFGLHKESPTCDFYVLIALKEDGEILKELIIPSEKLRMKNVGIGINSKYDIYKNRWDLLK